MTIVLNTFAPRRRGVRLLGVAALAVAALTFAGCSASGDKAADQSKAEGCTIITQSITDLSAAGQDTPAPTSAEEVAKVTDTMFGPQLETLKKVTNTELLPVVTTYSEGYTAWAKTMADDPANALSGQAFTDFSTGATALEDACK